MNANNGFKFVKQAPDGPITMSQTIYYEVFTEDGVSIGFVRRYRKATHHSRKRLIYRTSHRMVWFYGSTRTEATTTRWFKETRHEAAQALINS